MLQKCSSWNVASVFFNNPDKSFELREIAREINLAHTSVKKHLTDLIDQKIILTKNKSVGSKNYNTYAANKQNSIFTHYKLIFNLEKIYTSGIIQFLEKECLPTTIVLFGSFRRAEDHVDSDIDLYVQCENKTIELKKFEKVLNRKIQLHFNGIFKNYPAELKNNICNGIVLSGYLEAI